VRSSKRRAASREPLPENGSGVKQTGGVGIHPGSHKERKTNKISCHGEKGGGRLLFEISAVLGVKRNF